MDHLTEQFLQLCIQLLSDDLIVSFRFRARVCDDFFKKQQSEHSVWPGVFKVPPVVEPSVLKAFAQANKYILWDLTKPL